MVGGATWLLHAGTAFVLAVKSRAAGSFVVRLRFDDTLLTATATLRFAASATSCAPAACTTACHALASCVLGVCVCTPPALGNGLQCYAPMTLRTVSPDGEDAGLERKKMKTEGRRTYR